MAKSDISFFSNLEGDKLPNSNEFTAQQKELQKIFEELTNDKFNAVAWVKEFASYSKSHKRILYSILSGLIVKEQKETSIEYLTSHLDSLNQRITKNSKDKTSNQIYVDEAVYDAFYKFFDHCSLAIAQRAIYNQSDEISKKRTKDIVENQMKDLVAQQMSEYDKNITNQLIGLVSIFTALSFILFGGINSFESLMNKIAASNSLKLLFIGDLWFICMFNLLFIFVKLIATLTGKKKLYLWPYFFIVNAVLIGVMFFVWGKIKLPFYTI